MRTFGGHTLTAMLGMSYQESSYDYVSGTLNANGEHSVSKNDPLFYYLHYKTASATQVVDGETTRGSKLHISDVWAIIIAIVTMLSSPCVPMPLT